MPKFREMTAVLSQKKTFPGKIKHCQHLVVVLIDMLAAADSSSKHCLDGAKLKNMYRTVQLLPECLRLTKYLQRIA